MANNAVIKVTALTKTFVIQHERITTVRGLFVNMFKKKTSEQFKALEDVSFAVKKGECFGVIGRNGSGKSTLLKILAGIYRADSGNVEVHGRISPFLELGIGFHHELSGRDNVLLNGAVLGLTRKEIAAKFDEIVAFSELERFIDQKIKNYSSGMQVRLAFSVAVHVNREILLMDEVLAVGDANFQQKCLREFQRYRDLGKTVILVTHDTSLVRQYCDRAMLLRSGRIEKIGEPEEVCALYHHQNLADEESRRRSVIDRGT
ncbi:MAG: ABC transporter ATP-binding protein [Syntrophobacteraceae bacterium]